MYVAFMHRAHPGEGKFGLIGEVADFRVYKTALSDAEILTLATESAMRECRGADEIADTMGFTGEDLDHDFLDRNGPAAHRQHARQHAKQQ